MTTHDNTLPILLLDDDQFVREMAAMLLQGAGYKTVQARTAREATRLLAETKPVMAIVDYRLQGVDGATWIHNMRDANVKIPMVLLSGSVLDAKTVDILRSLLDVRLVLKKPINLDNFIEQLKPLLPTKMSPVVSDEQSISTSIHRTSFEPGNVSCDTSDSFQSHTLNVELALLRQEYVEAVRSDCYRLNVLLLKLAELQSSDCLEEVLSLAHRFRGNAGCYGFHNIGELAGQIEDLLRGTAPEELAAYGRQICHFRDAWSSQSISAGLLSGSNDRMTTTNVLLYGGFSDIALAELRASQGIRSLVANVSEDALRHLALSAVDLLCIEPGGLPIASILPVVFEARRARIPMVLSGRGSTFQKAERVYLGDSWSSVSERGAVSFSSELELTCALKEEWEALSSVACIPKSQVGYASLKKSDFVRLLNAMGQPIDACFALMEIDSLDEIGFLHGTEVQNSIVNAARNLLRLRFRFEDVRCSWSPDKLLLALPGLPLDLCESSITLFAEEFGYLAFQGNQGTEIKTKIKFAVVDDHGTATVDDLLKKVYCKLHNNGRRDSLLLSKVA